MFRLFSRRSDTACAQGIDLARTTDADLAALGLDRDTLAACARRAWDPPAYWLNRLNGIARSRQHLADLDDRMLRDIGVTRDQARHKAALPRWDLGNR